MKSTEFYHGQLIQIETQPNADGTWTAHAQLSAESGAEAETLTQSSTGQTEELAKQAVLSRAAGELDARRIHIGKP